MSLFGLPSGSPLSRSRRARSLLGEGIANSLLSNTNLLASPAMRKAWPGRGGGSLEVDKQIERRAGGDLRWPPWSAGTIREGRGLSGMRAMLLASAVGGDAELQGDAEGATRASAKSRSKHRRAGFAARRGISPSAPPLVEPDGCREGHVADRKIRPLLPARRRLGNRQRSDAPLIGSPGAAVGAGCGSRAGGAGVREHTARRSNCSS